MHRPHRLLDSMSDAARKQLADDVDRWGASLVGATMVRVADVITGGRTPSGRPSERAERVHAWLLRNELPEPAQRPPEAATRPTDDELTISRWDQADQPKPRNDFDKVMRTEDDSDPIESLIARREAEYERSAKKWAASRGPRQLRMPPGPYAIAHFGDPHLDDDGCDWPALLKAVRVVSGSPGFYGGNIGDTTNNWSGRHAELYANQSSTADDGWRLARWLMQALPWLYVVEGNHDAWGKGGVILKLLAEGAKIGLMAPDEVRLELVSPGAQNPVRLWCRHNFKGQSIWNQAHGPMRAAKLDPWGDVYVAGHLHEWVTHCEEGPDGKVRWAIRTRGFKRLDDYAAAGQFPEHKWGEVVSTVVDPGHAHPFERVRVHLDVEEASHHLAWLRKRRGF